MPKSKDSKIRPNASSVQGRGKRAQPRPRREKPGKAAIAAASSAQTPVPTASKKKDLVVLVPHPKKNRNGKQMYQSVPVVFSSTQKNVCEQPCDFEINSLKLALMSLASYLCNKGAVNNIIGTGLENPWESVYGGIDCSLKGIASEIQGGTAKLSSYPRVIGDLIAALKPKTVPFMTYGNQSYSWNPFDGSSLTLQTPINCPWRPTYVDPDADPNSPVSPAGKWSGSSIPEEDLYSGFLRVLTGSKLHPALEVVTEEKHKSQLSKDVSAFSRVYVYNGFQPSPTSGFWKDVENEVTITAPLYANFCRYDQPDIRTASKLTTYSGGAEMSVGGRILFDQLSAFNKTPPVFKEMDFEEIYTMLVLWMCQAKEQTIANAIGNFDGSAQQPLPFTMQDFRIVLRQALVSRFPSQCVAQFNAVLSPVGSNGFVPFNVMGNCCANPNMEQLLVPAILNENLANLQPRALQFAGKKGSHNATLYIPIWGTRSQDTPIIPQFIVNGNPVPLFSTKANEVEIDLANGAFGPNDDYANLNAAYYETILDDWNYHVTKLAAVMSDVSPMRGDAGPSGMGCLYMTRVVKTFATEGVNAAPKIPLRYVESLRFVKNNGIPKLLADFKSVKSEKEKDRSPLVKGNSGMLQKPIVKQEVTEVPPGSIVRNGVVQTLCNRKLLAEEEGLYEFLILPSLRTSATEDAISIQMYQTEVREPLSSFATNSVSASGADMYSRMQLYAALCIPGIGKNYSNQYSRVFSHLQDMNQGGVLSGILAGVVGAAFPGVKDIANTVASFIPI